MTGSAAALPSAAGTPPRLPGVAVAALGSAAGGGLHLLVPAVPWLTAALVLGVLVGCVPALRPALDGALKPGLAVAARRLLRLGIVLLGLRLSLADIARLGGLAIAAIVLLVVVSFAVTWLIARALRLPGDEPVLLAAGLSICGVSAVGAMSAARGSDERDAATPITMVTLFGTAAIVVLPALAAPLGLDAPAFGHWVGASVHDVGQVVATAGTAGAAALAVAVVVKLTRVLMLAPMVAIASLGTRRRGRAVRADGRPAAGSAPAEARADAGAAMPPRPLPPVVPLFIVGFVALMLVRTFVPVPEAVLGVADLVQSALLAAALFGIGAGLRLERLVRTGGRALAAGALSWVVILGLALPLAVLR
jgi:uncharacterized integral membrane protein (TIGR00698 family)